jgi:ADP-ribosylglycohydrolase
MQSQIEFTAQHEPNPKNLDLLQQKFQAAFLYSAIGDALGWTTEFLNPSRKTVEGVPLPLRDFIEWKKVIGGKWWGYEETIKPGQYSDDTQMNLALARCINESGRFEPNNFAYEELPLWLHYERGGGRSIKTAARKLIAPRANWLNNFYKLKNLDYRNAGANGAAMRNLPIALVSYNNEANLIKDSFYNAVITHGHPRAIIGTVLMGLAVSYLVNGSENLHRETFIAYLKENLQNIGNFFKGDDTINKWLQVWDKNSDQLLFRKVFDRSRQEAIGYLEVIDKHLRLHPKVYYQYVGALDPDTKGSGLATVCAAIFLFLKYVDEPQEGIFTAINLLGSDTDTIAAFLGSLFGAYHGLEAIPDNLKTRIQDYDYIIRTSNRLYSIATKTIDNQLLIDKPLERKDAYFRILAWEIGLHEMFWDALDDGGMVIHPTIGRGTIEHKEVKKIPKEGYVAKLIHITFECGQTCVFRSLVKNDNEVLESLASDVERALAAM